MSINAFGGELESEEVAPEKGSRVDLQVYKDYLKTLEVGKLYRIIVPTGEEVLKKVQEIGEDGKPKTVADPKTGRLMPVYRKNESGEFIMVPVGTGINRRGEDESANVRGILRAGVETDMTVNIKTTYLGRGKMARNEQTGVNEWIQDDSEPEKTRLTIQRQPSKRADTPEGALNKQVGLARSRRNKAQATLERATEATPEYKAELQANLARLDAAFKKTEKDLADYEANGKKAPEAAPKTSPAAASGKAPAASPPAKATAGGGGGK